MTIAEQVRNTITTRCPGTFSLYAGYGMAGAQHVRFPSGHQLRVSRNEKGRCTMAVYQYADDSKLTYRYKNDGSYTLEAA